MLVNVLLLGERYRRAESLLAYGRSARTWAERAEMATYVGMVVFTVVAVIDMYDRMEELNAHCNTPYGIQDVILENSRVVKDMAQMEADKARTHAYAAYVIGRFAYLLDDTTIEVDRLKDVLRHELHVMRQELQKISG